MLKMTWFEHTLKTKDDLLNMIQTFRNNKPMYGAFDTETNGLHIILSTPFLLAFGFVNPNTKEGHTYTIQVNNPLFHICVSSIISLFKRVKKVIAHNAKFDMHMMQNIGYPEIFKENITDTMIYIRLAHDALSKTQGGVPDALKDYTKNYITIDAKDHEKRIKAAITQRLKEHTHKLKVKLKELEPNENWTMAKVYDILNDQVVGMDLLTKETKKELEKWLNNTDDPSDYSKLPTELIEPYAHKDIIYALEAFLQTKEAVELRRQTRVLKIEEDLIVPLFHMERVGFAFNENYAYQARTKLKQYILKRREDLNKIAGQPLSIGQHKTIKAIFKEKYNLELISTAQDTLNTLTTDNPKINYFVDTILELRTLEKWYSTYMMRFLKEVHNGRIYTSIKQTGAVSGRVSSGFQQFPSKHIKDEYGDIIFEPRKMIQITGNGYNRLLYADYSQIELRIQALYTLKVGEDEGDLNLCRAYMPYRCFRINDGERERFDHTKERHLKAWNSNEWYLIESPEEKWKPIDLHTLTTKAAFPEISEKDPNFPAYRKIGKQTNFACNYGASVNALKMQLKFSTMDATKLYKAYTNSFPGVLRYRTAVNTTLANNNYVENLFGRIYYNASGHHTANYLIQGSAADFLKLKIIEIHNLLKNYRTRFQMNIHDELSFELHDDDPPELISKIKEIMENLPGTTIPIVADIEISTSTWADKKPYE